jgi:hypothetical protein
MSSASSNVIRMAAMLHYLKARSLTLWNISAHCYQVTPRNQTVTMLDLLGRD